MKKILIVLFIISEILGAINYFLSLEAYNNFKKANVSATKMLFQVSIGNKKEYLLEEYATNVFSMLDSSCVLCRTNKEYCPICEYYKNSKYYGKWISEINLSELLKDKNLKFIVEEEKEYIINKILDNINDSIPNLQICTARMFKPKFIIPFTLYAYTKLFPTINLDNCLKEIESKKKILLEKHRNILERAEVEKYSKVLSEIEKDLLKFIKEET